MKKENQKLMKVEGLKKWKAENKRKLMFLVETDVKTFWKQKLSLPTKSTKFKWFFLSLNLLHKLFIKKKKKNHKENVDWNKVFTLNWNLIFKNEKCNFDGRCFPTLTRLGCRQFTASASISFSRFTFGWFCVSRRWWKVSDIALKTFSWFVYRKSRWHLSTFFLHLIKTLVDISSLWSCLFVWFSCFHPCMECWHNFLAVLMERKRSESCLWWLKWHILLLVWFIEFDLIILKLIKLS